MALAAAGLVLLSLGAVAWYALQSRFSWRDPLAGARFTRLADFAGNAQAASISRDGRLVAFLAERDGRTDAWVGAAGSGAYLNLTPGSAAELANPAIRSLGFSPDATLVAVWTRRADGSRRTT